MWALIPWLKMAGLATYGVDYTTLGQETAKMVAEILEGTRPGDNRSNP